MRRGIKPSSALPRIATRSVYADFIARTSEFPSRTADHLHSGMSEEK